MSYNFHQVCACVISIEMQSSPNNGIMIPDHRRNACCYCPPCGNVCADAWQHIIITLYVYGQNCFQVCQVCNCVMRAVSEYLDDAHIASAFA